MRVAMEMEMQYAAEFPFVNYGIDLNEMAANEKGLRITRLSQVPTDTDKANHEPMRIPKDIKEDTERYLQNMRPRKYDLIPIKFWGKGGHGYMLYDWVHHRGKGAPKLTKQASDLIRHYYRKEEKQFISKELNKRMKLGGPRFAMMKANTRRSGLSNQ